MIERAAGRARRSWVWLAAALGPLVLFGPMLVRGEVLFWGTPLLQFVPWRTAALQAIRAGHLPLWNPLLGMGAPLLANYQVGVFYPPNWLLLLVGPAWGDGLLVALHLIWAGWGMAALCRRLGLGPSAQAVAAMGFSLSGYLVARAGFLSISAAAAWLPWAVWAADRLGQAAGQAASPKALGKAIGGFGLILGLQLLAGHAQTTAYTLAAAVAWAGGRAAAAGRWPGVWRAAAGLAGGIAVAACLAAVQLLPTAEYLAQSTRQSGVDTVQAMTYSFWPWRLLGFLLPNLFGSPVRGDYWGYGNYWEDAIYVGVLPLVMALAAAIGGLARRGARRWLVAGLVGMSAVASLLALGENTPIFPFLFETVPGFDLFQAPSRWMLLTVFALALLAGVGVEGWRAPQGRALYWTRLGTAGAAAMAVVAVLSRRVLTGLEPSFFPAFAQAGVLLAAVGALSLLRAHVAGRLWVAAMVVLVAVDLVAAGWGLNPATDPALFAGQSRLAQQVDPAHRILMAADVEYDLKFEHFFRFDRYAASSSWRGVRDSGLPNVSLLDGIATANNFDPLLTARYTTWMDMLEAQDAGRATALYRLMDVGAVARSAEGLPEVRYVPVAGATRLRLVPEAVWAETPEQALELTMAPGFVPEATVVLEGAPIEWGSGSNSGSRLALRDEADPNRLTVEVDSKGGGWLVLSDAWYPGWRATVDGEDVGLYRADFLFRAVPVPPGEHQVRFTYEPASLRIGGLLSLLTLVLMGGVGWAWRRD